jgi:DNA invertase Pin-like site-specific DNA recombinase
LIYPLHTAECAQLSCPALRNSNADLISERIKSGLAAAKSHGRKLGRQMGEHPKSDRLAPQVMALIAEGRSYRWIARDLGISKNAAGDVAKRYRPNDIM